MKVDTLDKQHRFRAEIKVGLDIERLLQARIFYPYCTAGPRCRLSNTLHLKNLHNGLSSTLPRVFPCALCSLISSQPLATKSGEKYGLTLQPGAYFSLDCSLSSSWC